MRLAGIRDGDIVRVEDPLPYHALVRSRTRGRLQVEAIGRCGFVRTVKAGEVVGFWRKAPR